MRQGGVFFIAGIVLVLVLLRGYYLGDGLPYTHDSQNHLGRMANYYLALKQGQLPPRWAPNLNNGFGYPVFNYNYPLANILAVPLLAVDVSVMQAFVLISMLGVLGSYIGMYLLIRTKADASIAMLGGILYALSNYPLQLLFVRGVIGETLAYGLLPWILYLIYQVYYAKSYRIYMLGLTLVGSMFVLAHNIMVLFGVPVIVGYSLILSGWKWGYLRRLIMPLVGVVLLTGFFTVPALGEKNLVELDGTQLISNYYQHFVYPRQLIYMAWDNGYSRPGPVDGMSFMVHPAMLVMVGLVLMAMIRYRIYRRKILFLLIGLSMVSLLMLSVSRPLWDMLPLLSYIQFPWRLGFFWPLFATLFIGWGIQHWHGIRMVCIVLFGLFLLSVPGTVDMSRTFSESNDHWMVFPETTTVQDENKPLWFRKANAYERKGSQFAKGSIVVEGNGTVDVQHIDGTTKRYLVHAVEKVRITEATTYFDGHEVYANTHLVTLDPRLDEAGLIAYELNPGNYEVISRFSQHTPYRRIGNLMTVVGVVGIGGMSLYAYKYR